MKIKASVFVATSFDGFIARKDGSLDWLDRSNEFVPKGEDCGYKNFMASVDALVMGRHTFEKVLSFGSEWPYGEKPVIVLSSRNIEIPERLKSTVRHASGSPELVIETLSREGFRHLYVDGGLTIQKFIAAGLIDTLIITLIPVLLGEGIPLFGPLNGKDISLVKVNARVYDFGFVQVTYDVVKGKEN